MAKRNPSSQSRSKSRGDSNGRRSPSRKRKRKEYPDYELVDPEEIDSGPDVMLDVPVVKVDEIDIEVENLRAAVSVRAELQELVQINVGVAARLGQVKLNIQGVEAQALLKARLDNVSTILARVLTSLDRNPELLESIGRTVEEVGGGARQTLEGAGGAVEEAGQGTGQAAGEIGQGTSQGIQNVGQGAGQAAQGVGQGAGQAAGQAGQIMQKTTGGGSTG